jgi:hypothetical protein
MPPRPMPAAVRAPRLLASATPMAAGEKVVLHPGTNGWTSVWGTLSHGEIAGCPPPRS